jgi:DNA-binding beta-propeller fold protein YncE
MKYVIAVVVTAAAAILAACGGNDDGGSTGTEETTSKVAPKFEVDPFWPKPLPNHWVMGSAIGVHVDTDDSVWIVHRSETVQATLRQVETKQGLCCAAAPPVLHFNADGTLMDAWGGPPANKAYDWPSSNHGIFVDHHGNVWIGGNGGGDSHILKFTQKGEFLAQYGKPDARAQTGTGPDGSEGSVAGYAANSNDPNNFGRVAKIYVDPKEDEAYIADGYLNHRVAVLDAGTGKMKRHWGAYGSVPDDTPLGPYNPNEYASYNAAAKNGPKQFRNPVHCANLSVDRLVYVCDRVNDRLQVFNPDGTFIKEVIYKPATRDAGSVWDIAFSKDPQQKYIYMADGVNEKVAIFDRPSLTLLSTFGDGGVYAGMFHGVHSIATDSKGNIYTTETYEGRRIQKFRMRNEVAVPASGVLDQGVPWPSGN